VLCVAVGRAMTRDVVALVIVQTPGLAHPVYNRSWSSTATLRTRVALFAGVMGTLVWRAMCELRTVIFGISDRLGQIREQLVGARNVERSAACSANESSNWNASCCECNPRHRLAGVDRSCCGDVFRADSDRLVSGLPAAFRVPPGTLIERFGVASRTREHDRSLRDTLALRATVLAMCAVHSIRPFEDAFEKDDAAAAVAVLPRRSRARER